MIKHKMAQSLTYLENRTAEQSPLLRKSIWFTGSLMTVHADASDTKGVSALIEMAGYPGFEPPLHSHRNEDELFYVLEGSLKIFRGSEQLILCPGEAALLPRGIPHTFQINSETARWLVHLTPGGFEGFFRDLGRPAETLAVEDPPSLPDVRRMLAVGEKYGLTFYPQMAKAS